MNHITFHSFAAKRVFIEKSGARFESETDGSILTDDFNTLFYARDSTLAAFVYSVLPA